MMNIKDSGLKWLWLAVVMLVLDQLTKQLVVASMSLYQSIEVLPFFNFTYVHNTGAAFSFLADAGGWQRWFFSAIAIGVSSLLVYWMAKAKPSEKLICISYALIISGALGNLIDRMAFGYVIDFLDFYVGNKHWPAFNIADSAIFVGAALMIFEAFTNDSDNRDNDNKSNAKNA
ncbi:lipoprotein signal peptidase [Thalassotalea litorea]|uniref:Lipoprotein signal peptidase n=1 Tax=Thalassotalea litorea TaxID=2020715 RepID=A0A5R9IH26_9GAMM|nr:signal peptidase II [Thalassotalea litorea]TLU61458.1 lipoprotein signal peptidase [Thalassotalea litorea]